MQTTTAKPAKQPKPDASKQPSTWRAEVAAGTQLLTAGEWAAELGVSHSTIHRWARECGLELPLRCMRCGVNRAAADFDICNPMTGRRARVCRRDHRALREPARRAVRKRQGPAGVLGATAPGSWQSGGYWQGYRIGSAQNPATGDLEALGEIAGECCK